jgi:hypothetical protein
MDIHGIGLKDTLGLNIFYSYNWPTVQNYIKVAYIHVTLDKKTHPWNMKDRISAPNNSVDEIEFESWISAGECWFSVFLIHINSWYNSVTT